jgi:hypothetical protein
MKMPRLKSRISLSLKRLLVNNSPEIRGRCLCGGVSVSLPFAVHDVGVCHCKMCRQWTSGPWLALHVPDAVVEGDTLVTFKASSFAERGFCSRCGAHIFHRPVNGPELAVSAGLFDDKRQFIDREIFVDSQPPHYGFENRGSRRTAFSMAAEWLPKLIWRRLKG